MALAIGGTTVEELRFRVSYYEIQGWLLFEEEFGPLHLGLRIERAIAQAVSPFLKNASVKDLMPWPREPREDRERLATKDDFMKILKPAGKRRSN